MVDRRRWASLVGVLFLVSLLGAASPAAASPCTLAWCASVSPSVGPVGTRVSVQGQIAPANSRPDFQVSLYNLRHSPGFLFLMRDVSTGCEMMGGVHGAHFSVSEAGVIMGSFIVGGSTDCNHSDAQAPRLSPGTYSVNLGCVACAVDTFTVTDAQGNLPFTGGRSVRNLTLAGLVSLLIGVALVSLVPRRGPSTAE
jgi:hypothetical protein